MLKVLSVHESPKPICLLLCITHFLQFFSFSFRFCWFWVTPRAGCHAEQELAAESGRLCRKLGRGNAHFLLIPINPSNPLQFCRLNLSPRFRTETPIMTTAATRRFKLQKRCPTGLFCVSQLPTASTLHTFSEIINPFHTPQLF